MTNKEKHNELYIDMQMKFKALEKADLELTSFDGFGNTNDMSQYVKAVKDLDVAADKLKEFMQYCKENYLNPNDTYNEEACF